MLLLVHIQGCLRWPEQREVKSRRILTLLVLLAAPAHAQFSPLAADGPPDGEALFRRQCATCHALSATGPARQGPHLVGVIGRRAGSVPGYKYSDSYKTADFSWDEANLDPYLANPQQVMPGSVMAYRGNNPGVRRAIIEYLKGQ